MTTGTRPATRGDLLPSAVLGLLGTRGPTSRAEVARILAVSPATVTQLTRDLIARGLITELETSPSEGGRPARLLGLVQAAGGALGVKVAATHVALVDVGLDGTVQHSSTAEFDASSPTALDHLARILKDAVSTHSGNLLGVGVGVPGGVDSQASGIVEAPTLGWTDARVGPILRSALGVPVLVENDVNTLAVAERLYGSMRNHLTYLVVTIGLGVGCGIVIDGSVYRGATGGAGEIGHITVSADGPACGCGGKGCLEAHVGEHALIGAAVTQGVIAPGESIDALRAAADQGDDAARAIYHNAGALLGRVLAGVVHTLDPEIVVFSGEGIAAWPHWSTGFEESFRARLMPSRRHVPYAIEPWADDKWALGAAALVLATPFDAAGAAGDQGRLVRQRLHAGGALS